MLKFVDVPYRVWRRRHVDSQPELVTSKQAGKVMKIMADAIKGGKAVDFVQSQPKTKVPHIGEKMRRSDILTGAVYDTISLTVTD